MMVYTARKKNMILIISCFLDFNKMLNNLPCLYVNWELIDYQSRPSLASPVPPEASTSFIDDRDSPRSSKNIYTPSMDCKYTKEKVSN